MTSRLRFFLRSGEIARFGMQKVQKSREPGIGVYRRRRRGRARADVPVEGSPRAARAAAGGR